MRRKFQIIEAESDYEVAVYSFSGRMTKLRWKILDRYCRNHSRSMWCGCQHDCCGCISSTNMHLQYKHNLVTLTYTLNYNY